MDLIIGIPLFLVLILSSAFLAITEKNRYKNALTFLCWLIISFIYTISFGLYLAGMTEPKNVRIVSFALKICFYTLIPVMAMISIYFYRCFFRSKGGEKTSSPHSVLDKATRQM